MLPSKYYVMARLCFGLVVGYFYDLDYRLTDDIGVSVVIDMLWG